MDWQNWIPVIVSGLFVAFGAAIWLWFRKLVKQFGSKLEGIFQVIDTQSEKWMGVKNSNEMWEVIGAFGLEIANKAEKMKNQISFRPDDKPDARDAGEGVVDLSDAVSKQSASKPRRTVAKNT